MTESDVRAAAGGDRDAFARVIEGTQSVVTSIALAITGDVARSQDVAQDVYLAAWRGLPSLRAPEKFEAWLRRIVRNRARSARSARPREAALSEIADERPGALDSLVDAEDARRLDEVIAALPLATRQVVVLFYRSGCSLTETAERLGVSEDVVKKRLSRAREKIRAEVLDSAGRAIVRSSPAGGLVALVLAALPAGPPVPASPFAGIPRGLALGASVAAAVATVVAVTVITFGPSRNPNPAGISAAAAVTDTEAGSDSAPAAPAPAVAPAVGATTRAVPPPSSVAGAPAPGTESLKPPTEEDWKPEDEARMSLTGILMAEKFHFDTHGRFSEDFVALDWFPGEETPTYVFGFCGGGPRSHTMAAGSTAPLAEEHAVSVTKTLPLSDPCAVLASLGIDTTQFRAGEGEFKAFAIGNLDDDPELDVWTMTNRKQLEHVRHDRAPTVAK